MTEHYAHHQATALAEDPAAGTAGETGRGAAFARRISLRRVGECVLVRCRLCGSVGRVETDEDADVAAYTAQFLSEHGACKVGGLAPLPERGLLMPMPRLDGSAALRP